MGRVYDDVLVLAGEQLEQFRQPLGLQVSRQHDGPRDRAHHVQAAAVLAHVALQRVLVQALERLECLDEAALGRQIEEVREGRVVEIEIEQQARTFCRRHRQVRKVAGDERGAHAAGSAHDDIDDTGHTLRIAAQLGLDPGERCHEFLRLERLDEKVFCAAANRKAHGFGIGRRSDDHERRSPCPVLFGERCKLREVLGIEAQQENVRHARNAVQRIRVTVVDQTEGARELRAVSETRLQRLERGLRTTGYENFDLCGHDSYALVNMG